jgi:hypothetical protein
MGNIAVRIPKPTVAMVAHQGRPVKWWKESITDMAVETIGPVVVSIAIVALLAASSAAVSRGAALVISGMLSLVVVVERLRDEYGTAAVAVARRVSDWNSTL